MAQNDNSKRIKTYKKIRSKYILSQIFDNLNQLTKLKIINYNKDLINTLGVKIKDYKIAYSKIEIEIIPVENPFGRFIHFSNKKNTSNYTIYFDDIKVDLLKKELFPDINVKKIRVILNNRIKSLAQLFLNCRCVKKIRFTKFNRNACSIDVNH